jgi:hypothetical protein
MSSSDRSNVYLAIWTLPRQPQSCKIDTGPGIDFVLRVREGKQCARARSGGKPGRYVSCGRWELESLRAWMVFGDLRWPLVRGGLRESETRFRFRTPALRALAVAPPATMVRC